MMDIKIFTNGGGGGWCIGLSVRAFFTYYILLYYFIYVIIDEKFRRDFPSPEKLHFWLQEMYLLPQFLT